MLKVFVARALPFMKGHLVRMLPKRPAWTGKVGQFVWDMVSDKDGKSAVLARVLSLGIIGLAMVLTTWSVIILKTAINMTDYGTGMSLLMAASGIWVAVTHKSEPS